MLRRRTDVGRGAGGRAPFRQGEDEHRGEDDGVVKEGREEEEQEQEQAHRFCKARWNKIKIKNCRSSMHAPRYRRKNKTPS